MNRETQMPPALLVRQLAMVMRLSRALYAAASLGIRAMKVEGIVKIPLRARRNWLKLPCFRAWRSRERSLEFPCNSFGAS